MIKLSFLNENYILRDSYFHVRQLNNFNYLIILIITISMKIKTSPSLTRYLFASDRGYIYNYIKIIKKLY